MSRSEYDDAMVRLRAFRLKSTKEPRAPFLFHTTYVVTACGARRSTSRTSVITARHTIDEVLISGNSQENMTGYPTCLWGTRSNQATPSTRSNTSTSSARLFEVGVGMQIPVDSQVRRNAQSQDSTHSTSTL
ncbi:hypothetical protein DIJ64_12885 [Mycobacterium leprae]|uniref:Uncharacterized protein n=1 Tax=Mycobacterium leprae TaxID=1769 RepID=A0AAD0KVK5_MYCLR|nr:hypothetical protein DIJ64_12885 [Mycobacterium leprae]OAR21112.1 hypothetical protein A8144_01195 [Mycobacterium leprae 3125609]